MTRDALIVEDDWDAAEALAEVLDLLGYSVRTARNGIEGLSLMHDRRPDVVLVDVDMPLLDGPSMALRMFVEDAGLERIPLVLLSGVPDLKAVAHRVGTPYFLSKPYRIEALETMMSRAVAERRAPDHDGS
jgi:DNA-binding NtrC family response regulator